MKPIKLASIFIFAFLTFNFQQGQLHITEPLAQASETVEGAKKDLESFKHEMRSQLSKIEGDIKTIKNKAAVKKDETHAQTTAELENMRDKFKAKLKELDESSASTWHKLKKGIADSADELNAKVQKAFND